MSIEGQGHFFTIYFPGFVCFVLYLAKISGERLQDHWSSGSWLFLFGYISYLQVTVTYMRAWMSLKFGQILLLVSMATDRVIMEKTILPLFLGCFLSDSFHTCR